MQSIKGRPTLSIDKKATNQQIIAPTRITHSQQIVEVEEESRLQGRLGVRGVRSTNNVSLLPFNSWFIPLCSLSMRTLLLMGM